MLEDDGFGTAQRRHTASFALYGAANRMVRMHKPFLEPLGLTFPQYLVILELLDGAPLSVGDARRSPWTWTRARSRRWSSGWMAPAW